ncbi:MAG TPA: ABATE domain-containing protein [Verrucomicrobiae bacterium]|nr:ABATE domain-containing protein [Verrucomicrobiae bacterium]
MALKAGTRRPPQFDLIAGNVALDFVNTLDDRHIQPRELLTSYVDLVRFGEDTGLLDPVLTDRLLERSVMFPQKAQEALKWARRLREAIHDVFWAVINQRPVPAPALGRLNADGQTAAAHLRLRQVDGRFAWEFDDMGSFDCVLWPLARAAVELLASGELPFVRACASKECEWFFLDTSKNHHRRWCDMTRCGNRAKSRRFYSRQKKAR